MDGSEIRSLSGRSATLGDSFSRNPKDRDALLAARTKDLEGLTGQLRGFDLDQYLGEGTEGEGPVPWAVGNDAVREQAASVPPFRLPSLQPCQSESWSCSTMPGGRTRMRL